MSAVSQPVAHQCITEVKLYIYIYALQVLSVLATQITNSRSGNTSWRTHLKTVALCTAFCKNLEPTLMSVYFNKNG